MITAADARAKREPADMAFYVGGPTNLPFPAGHFDAVVAVTILCFVADPATVFDEIARVLRPGGRLEICNLGKWSTWAVEDRVRAWFGERL
jgi:ubiquinone/menaquinone biosynthesis C-methylase UbiE